MRRSRSARGTPPGGRVPAAGVRRDPAERRHGGVHVHTGAQNGQFPLVGGSEVGLDVVREVPGVEPGEQVLPLPGFAGEVPQECQGPVAYGAQFGRDREAWWAVRGCGRSVRGRGRSVRPGQGRGRSVRRAAEAERPGQRRSRTVPADGLQGVQGGGRDCGQEGQHRLLGGLGTQDADRGEERTRGAGGREEPGDGLADGDVGGPLPRQGDEQLQAARPVRGGGRGVDEGVEQRAAAGVEDRRDVLRRKRVVGQGQGEERADVRVRRKVPAPVQSAQTGQHGSGEQKGIRVEARATRRPTSVRSARSPRSSTACPRRAGVPAGSSAVLHSTVG